MAKAPRRERGSEQASEIARLAVADREALYHDAPVGLCVMDAELRYLSVNRRFVELTGKPATFYLGRKLAEISPAALRQTQRLFRQLVATGQPIRNIEYLRDTATTTGTERSWLAHWFPIKDARGRVVAVNIAFEESTELKRAEVDRDKLLETLDTERRRLSAVLAQLPTGVIISEAPSGRIVLANTAAARIHRTPVPKTDRIADYRKWRVLALDGRPLRPAEYPLARAIRSGKVITGATHFIQRGDGTRGVVHANAAPIRDARGKIVAGAVTISDVTQEHETLEALRQSEARFRKIAENSPFGINAYNERGEVVFMNPKLTDMIGYRAKDVPRREDWYRRAYPDPKYRREVMATWAADIARVRSGELRHSPVREYRITCRDGSVKVCEITFAQSPGARYSMFNDVTERKRAEAAILALNAHLEERVAERTAQLHAANRELRREIAERQRLQSQLIAVSEREQRHLGESLHDMLGQQLTGLGMMASVLERQLRGEGHAAAEGLARLGAMLKDAVRAARDLSRGFYPVVLEQCGLILALQDLAAHTRAVSGVRCRVTYRPTFHFPAVAAIHLFRIAQEAVTNALKHAAPREIHLELTTRRRISLLRIVNDGRPYRPPRTTGAGLGLHIIHHRAELIGAEITIARGEPRGCVVTCTLPGVRKASRD